MIDLLTKMGIPSVIVLSISVITIFLWHYFKHRLELQRKQFEAELKLIQDLHKERFEAVCSMTLHLNQLEHNIFQISNLEQSGRIPVAKHHAYSLRELVREKALILKDSISPKVYALTDYAQSVIDGKDKLDYKTWDSLANSLRGECDDIIRTLPRIDYELRRIKKGQKNHKALREK